MSPNEVPQTADDSFEDNDPSWLPDEARSPPSKRTPPTASIRCGRCPTTRLRKA